MIRHCIGIDVSKDSLSICYAIMKEDRQIIYCSSKTVTNNTPGFKSMIKWYKSIKQDNIPPIFVMEATGVYYENLAFFLNSLDHQLAVLLPSKVKAYAKSLDWKSKTDKIDAKVLATLGLERNLKVWQLPAEDLALLKQLTRERFELIKERTQVSNRLHAKKTAHATAPSAIKRSKKRIQFINKQIEDIQQELETTVKENQKLNQLVKRLTTIKGLGALSVITILAETNGFALFENRKQLASYAGYDVIEKESGISVKAKTRISKKGNKHIRRALHYPALSAKIHDENFKTFYNRVHEKSGIKMVGIVAVQRKLLLLMFSLFKSGQTYQNGFKKAAYQKTPLTR